MLSVQIEGLSRLQGQFAEMNRRAQGAVLRKALRAAGRPVVNDARARAPRRRGKLKRGIQQRVTVNRTDATTDISWRKKEYYGLMQEKGWRHGRPRPFLKDALLQNQPAVIDAFRQAVRDEITSLAKG